MGREGPASREDSLIPTLPRFLYFLLLSWGLVGAGGVGVIAHSAWSLGNDPGLEGQWNDDFLPRPDFRRLEAGWCLTFLPKASLARLEEGCGRWVGSG